MYDKTDPRASLVSSKSDNMLMRSGLVAEEQRAYFYDESAQADDVNGLSWMHRAHNFLVSYSKATKGARFERVNQIDEYCALFPSSGGQILWNGETTDIPGFSIAFVPPGDSAVVMAKSDELVRVFSTKNKDLAEMCGNARGYDEARSHIPEFQTWPMPTGGWKVRVYSLNVPKEEGRFGRIFRCSTLMINVLYPFEGPRDSSKMSPHHHDDFEQGSLALAGEFSHYLRWPWTTDMADWKDDQTIKMGSPSMLVIPPPVIHTTRATGQGSNFLVDIFGPPRMDFSNKDGWVLNSEDYPMIE